MNHERTLPLISTPPDLAIYYALGHLECDKTIMLRRLRLPLRSQNTYAKCLLPFRHISMSELKSQTPIVEEFQDTPDQAVTTLRHYMKTADIPQNIRLSKVKEALVNLVKSDEEMSPEVLRVINTAFLFISRGTLEKMDPSWTIKLFERTLKFLNESDTPAPEYMGILSQHFSLKETVVPSMVLAQVAAMDTVIRNVESSEFARFVVEKKGTELPWDFLEELLAVYKAEGRLDLGKFDNLLALVKVNPLAMSDGLCMAFIDYIESIFQEASPNLHETKDPNKNIYRVQSTARNLLDNLNKDVTPFTALRVHKLKTDLNEVVETQEDVSAFERLVKRFDDYDEAELTRAISEVDPDVRRSAFISAASTSPGSRVIDIISEYELSQEEPDVLILAYEKLSKSSAEIESIVTTINSAPGFESLIHASLLARVPKAVLSQVTRRLYDSPDFEPTLNAVRMLIDNSLKEGDYVLAYKQFVASTKIPSIQWEQTDTPGPNLTLNNLITEIARNEISIQEIFSKFRIIRLFMTGQCSADTLAALATKMLAEECVGDVLEMLRRELPKLDKELPYKLPTTEPWATSHRKLFDTLHDFVITYTGEETHETNWVLYCDLHKYFMFPFESYLPALKYFCEVDRLNAALTVFRQVKSLNELHGAHHHLPPLRDMYMYLVKEFGDKLYEEGVIEIHEYFKMDTALETDDIQLQNRLLDAYLNLQLVPKARDLFLSISANSKVSGGVNEETARIMIKTYTYSDMSYVKNFWDNMSLFGVFPDHQVYKQYLIAHVYHGLTDEAFKLVEEVDDYNLEFSADMLLAMNNFCLNPAKQKKIQDWAIKNHEEMWKDLQGKGLILSATPYMPDKNLLTGKS